MLKNRLVTGFSVAGFFLLSIIVAPYWVLLLLILAVFVLAQTEYREMVRSGGLKVSSVSLFLCSLAYILAATLETPLIQARFPGLASALPRVTLSDTLVYVTPAVLLSMEVLRRKPQGAIHRFGLGLVGFWYVAILLSFMVRIAFAWEDSTGRWALVYFLWVVKFSDIGAFSIGTVFGRKSKRRLIPEISPAKSHAGLIGAYAVSIFASLVWAAVLHIFFDGKMLGMRLPWLHAALLGAVMTTLGVMGDLGESLFKRSLGVKDSSSRFPGFGGFLDMLDSLLFCAPFMYLYIQWFAK